MLVRITPTLDKRTNLYFLEIYYPADGESPLITTQAVYQTESSAEQDLLAILAAAASRGS